MDDSKYIKIFCSEADEHVSAISGALKVLVNDPRDRDAIDTLMGRLHSIKGISGTMGYAPLSKLSHKTEDLIVTFVSNDLPLDDQSLKLIYEVIDVIERFKKSLPEVRYDAVLKLTDRIRQKISGEPVTDDAIDNELSEQMSLSVNDMLSSIDRNIKINVSIIDELIGDISELKYTESALKSLNEKLGSYNLKLIIKRIEKQLKKLYNSLIDLKMQPFDTIISQLERTINEYCLTTGKKISFVVNTNNIIIDSTVLKTLISPLIHLIRNAIDHGIEPVNERKKLKKAAKGTVSMTVNKVLDFAEITINDDGRGLPIELILKKAAEKGYISALPGKVDDKLLLYILTHPGFTTRDKVSLVSGRGIGLDVVKSSLDNVGGSVSIETKKAKGTVIKVKVPISTSVIKSLLVTVNNDTVAIPSSNIEKVLSVKKDSLAFDDNGVPCGYTDNDKTFNAKYLGSLLESSDTKISHDDKKDQYNIILTKMRDEVTAVLVDDLISEEDLFINPLTKPLKKMKSVLGYSILGNGSPVFLLDVNNL